MKKIISISLALFVWFCSPVLAQETLFAGHSGGGGNSEPNPGAFSQVDPDTGTVTVIGTANTKQGGVSGLAYSGGTIFATFGGGPAQLVTIDPSTGEVIETIGTVTVDGKPCSVGDLAMASGGPLFAITANARGHICDGNDENDINAGTILTINPGTGEATVLGRPMEDEYFDSNVNGGLAVDGSGNLWLLPGWGHPDPGKIFTLNTSTGLVDSVLTLTGDTLNEANGLAWNPQDGMLYASWDQSAGLQSFWRINPTTGETTLINAETGHDLHDLVFASDIASVPSEPVPTVPFGGLVLLVALMGWFGLRKFRVI